MLNFENSLTFIKGQEPAVTLRNFWPTEDGFVWSTGKWCELHFPFDPGPRPFVGLADLILDIDAFKVDNRLTQQHIYVYLNGLRIGTILCTKRITAIVPFDAKILVKGDNIMTIDTPESAKPSAYGSPDERTLGVQLFSVQVRKAG